MYSADPLLLVSNAKIGIALSVFLFLCLCRYSADPLLLVSNTMIGITLSVFLFLCLCRYSADPFLLVSNTMISITLSVFLFLCLCRYSADPLLLVSNTMIGITLSVLPLCDTLVILLVDLAVMGFFMGIIDTTANVSLLKIYGRLVSPFLQVSGTTVVWFTSNKNQIKFCSHFCS